MFYSRNILLSLRNCWKSTSQTCFTSHALRTKPLPRCVWENLKSLNLLASGRGKRGGRTHRPTVTTGTFPIKPWITSHKFRSRTTAPKQANLLNLLNIQTVTSSIKTTLGSFRGFPELFLSNTRSLVNKTEELTTTIQSLNPDVVILTETWLSSNITDDLISIPQYSIYRKDRPFDKRGGGVCIYIRNNMNHTPLSHLNNSDIESFWTLLKPDRLPRGISSIILAAVYHPPNADDQLLRHHLHESLDSALIAHPNSAIILAGDFNQFVQTRTCSSFHLKNVVLKPTRGNNILDKIFVSVPNYYNKAEIFAPIGHSDHSSVMLKPCQQYKLPTQTVSKRRYPPGNRRAFEDDLHKVNWTPIYHLPTCCSKLTFFMDQINNLMDKHFPLKTFKLHPTDKPWITPEIKNAVKKRQRAWALNNIPLFTYYRNHVNKLCKKAKRTYYKMKLDNSQASSHNWWKEVKQLSGTSTNKPSINILQGNEILSGPALANFINQAFSNVASDLTPISWCPLPISVEEIPEKFFIPVSSVQKALSTINTCKSSGPDNIPNWLLKNNCNSLSQPICHIFNTSVQEGSIPALWKCADVIPLPKTKSIQSAEDDLRPISLTTVLSKVLENYICTWLWPYISERLDPYQYGCIKGSSTTHALIRLTHNWLKATDSPGNIIRSCMIDFSKAFDRIDHTIILHKLKDLDIHPLLLNWIADFLQDRTQRVKLTDCFSDWLPKSAGVPQGTKLGPLLFMIMINDLTLDATSDIHPIIKYVDDCTVYETYNKNSHSTLQNQLNEITSWTSANNMKINIKKTKELRINFLKQPLLIDPLRIDGNEIEITESFKLLGIWFTPRLTWNVHVDKITAKASKRLYVLRILKRAGFRPIHLCRIYCCFIRPLLEYGCPVWHTGLPTYLSDIIEKIQKRALFIIYPDLNYTDSLGKADLVLLSTRRDNLCKTFFKSVSTDKSKLFDLLPEQAPQRYDMRIKRRFPLVKCRTERFKNSFIPFAVQHFL